MKVAGVAIFALLIVTFLLLITLIPSSEAAKKQKKSDGLFERPNQKGKPRTRGAISIVDVDQFNIDLLLRR